MWVNREALNLTISHCREVFFLYMKGCFAYAFFIYLIRCYMDDMNQTVVSCNGAEQHEHISYGSYRHLLAKAEDLKTLMLSQVCMVLVAAMSIRQIKIKADDDQPAQTWATSSTASAEMVQTRKRGSVKWAGLLMQNTSLNKMFCLYLRKATATFVPGEYVTPNALTGHLWHFYPS